MHSATLGATSATSSSRPPEQPIISLTTSDIQSTSETTSGHNYAMPPTLPATRTTTSTQLHSTHEATSQLTLRKAGKDVTFSCGTDLLSPALSTTPTTSATMSTTSQHENHKVQSIASYTGALHLQSTSKAKSTSYTVAKCSFGATPTTPPSNTKQSMYPKVLPLTSLPNLKSIKISRISPPNVEPTTPATSLATSTTTEPTTHDSLAISPMTQLHGKCTSTSSPSQSPCHSSTRTTSTTASPTTLPLDLHNTVAATQASTSELPHLSLPHLNSSQPFHPGKLSRNQLPLDMKIEAIRLHEEEGLSGRSIMEVMNIHGFKCGKTQVQNILKRKHEWIEQYAQNVPLTRKRKLRKTGNEEINHKVYEWFEEAIDRMIPVNGPMLQQKAVEIARELGITEFKGSNGWLESFRKRHSISFGKIPAGGAAGENEAQQRKEYRYMFERAKSNPHGNDAKNPMSELPQMIVGEFLKKSAPQSSTKNSLTEENISPKVFPRVEKMLLKKEGNNWCKETEEDNEEGVSCSLKDQTERDDLKDTEMEEGRGTLSHPKFKSIHGVAAALREMRVFFATSNYSHLLDSCLDLEEQVALECIAKREAEEKSTVLDHLNPLDTRPSSNMDQP